MSKCSLPTTPRLERDRTPSLMTDEELRNEYVQLRKTHFTLNEESVALQAEIGALCEESVRLQQSTEIEEEKLANQLLRRLQIEELQRSRLHALIRREEVARQQIMEQIAQVRGQKTELKTQVEQEQESLMLQLQKKLVEVVNSKREVERELLKERRSYLDVLSKRLAHFKRDSDATPAVVEASAAPPVALRPASEETHVAINHLERQLNDLLRRHAAAVRASAINESLCAELGRSLASIQQAAFLDRARAAKLREELLEAQRRLGALETQRRSGGIEAQIRTRGTSVVSDDSSGLPTPKWAQPRPRSPAPLPPFNNNNNTTPTTTPVPTPTFTTTTTMCTQTPSNTDMGEGEGGASIPTPVKMASASFSSGGTPTGKS
ncbi:uncharacterized protein TM35_000015050 [Trypanosoma theileri]|uniref:Uncharacterized protein n=1 Tax=Trypanosoma theileri TaxID=67003 RepID=A0A1X0P9R4_9TRYP|nr:uncharacterized protein TM35_000015050 [Trypanosoma theileri]ORC93628.1 hypothetical protein TM35_000015050 [Trypanosoma theileri]